MAHIWLSQAALDLALVAALEHKPEYAAKAAEILSKYAAAYPGPHTDAVTGGMVYQSLCEAMWVIPLAQAYDLAYEDLSPEQRAKAEQFLRTVAEGLQRCGTRGNWGSWHLSAVGVVGYAIEDQELVAWATERFKQQIREQLGDDGLWPESVHTYHYFPLRAFMDFAEAAWHAGTDLYHWEAKPGKSLLTMFTAPLQYAYPDLRLAAINDGWFESFVPADCYELAYHRTQDPRFAWVLANGYRRGVLPAGRVNSSPRDSLRSGLHAFLFGGAIPANVTPPSAASVNFPVLGICMLRSTNGAMLSFDYGPFLGHGQRDKMGITLFADRKLWLADYGTPGYGASILPWYQSTFAHNTVVVDGKSQNPTKENNVKLWLGEPDLEAAQSETTEAYPGVAHTRTVVRIGDCFVVADQLKSDTEHTYDLYLHSEGKLSLDRRRKEAHPVTPPVPWIEKLTALTPATAVLRPLDRGGQRRRILAGRDQPGDTDDRAMPGRNRLAQSPTTRGAAAGPGSGIRDRPLSLQAQARPGCGTPGQRNHRPPRGLLRCAHFTSGWRAPHRGAREIVIPANHAKHSNEGNSSKQMCQKRGSPIGQPNVLLNLASLASFRV